MLWLNGGDDILNEVASIATRSLWGDCELEICECRYWNMLTMFIYTELMSSYSIDRLWSGSSLGRRRIRVLSRTVCYSITILFC
jgi:hypothetical protein